MFHNLLILALVCLTAFRLDLPHVNGASAPEGPVCRTNDRSDEPQYPADESEFPVADELEVFESESKQSAQSFCDLAPVDCGKLGGCSRFRESPSVPHFSLGAFDILDRLRL